MADKKCCMYPSTVKQNTISFVIRYSWNASLTAAARQEFYVEGKYFVIQSVIKLVVSKLCVTIIKQGFAFSSKSDR